MTKQMWGYIVGTLCKPRNEDDEKYAEQLDVWKVNNLKIIIQINNSIENSIGTQLTKYETTKETWEHLKRLYMQSNFGKQYQLKVDIQALEQKNMSIQEFYSTMNDLWTSQLSWNQQRFKLLHLILLVKRNNNWLNIFYDPSQ